MKLEFLPNIKSKAHDIAKSIKRVSYTSNSTYSVIDEIRIPDNCIADFASDLSAVIFRHTKKTKGCQTIISDYLEMIDGQSKYTNGQLKLTNSHQNIVDGLSKKTPDHIETISGHSGIKKIRLLRSKQQLRMSQSNQLLKQNLRIMKNQTIGGKLLFAQNAIANALSTTEISNALAVFGYDQTQLKAGEALYNKASDLHTKQVKEYGEQFAATDALNLAKAEANKAYIIHLKIARVALKGNRGTAESLQMSGERKESLSGWLKQAKAFYENSLNTTDVQTALAKFGITVKKLKAGQSLVVNVENRLNAQLKEKGEAQAATQERDEAFDDLQDWMSDFIAIARIALEGQSQYLEVLGIVK